MAASHASPETSSRGALVVLEGLDRAGKSSQCRLLHDRLQSLGIPVRLMKFPDRSTPTGVMIDSYLTGTAQQEDHSIHLLFSANRWEAIGGILSDVERGVTVIVDRYSFSGAVYSAAKDNPDLSLEWAWAPEIGLPKPDVTLFLHISPQEAAGRGGFGAERYETTAMQARVRELFAELFSRLGDDEPPVRTVDAGRSVDEVAEDVLRVVLQCIERLWAVGPLKRLGPLHA